MNKKLLLATMSLAALAACTNDDDFGSKTIAEETSPVQFEVLNNNQAMTRASMNGNTISWSAADGDLFTLYHGGELDGDALKGFQNATYTASTGEGAAILSTPSMILPKKAIMVWPVDTAFTNDGSAALAISIPEVQTSIENQIPYVSDLIDITNEANWEAPTAAYNKAGYKRTYPVYMRPMASQLTIKADYAGTEETIAALYEGGSACPADGGIDPIRVTSVQLTTSNQFTTKIPLNFTEATAAQKTAWSKIDNVKNNAWSHITGFGTTPSDQSETLETKCLTGNESCKFLILPQEKITTDGAADAGVVVNTIYGKVTINEANYNGVDEYKDSWYRFVSNPTAPGKVITGETPATSPEASGDNAGKYKTTANIAVGLKQTLNGFLGQVASKGVVKDEPVGVATTRYVKVLLNKLDMTDLHIKNDKHLRDVAVVWQYLYPEATTPITVILDGDENGEFAISQNTIKFINTLKKEDGTPLFTVKPCKDAGEVCETIVITGGGDIQDLPFIMKNASTMADVAFNAGETWNWKGDVKVNGTTARGIKSFVNRGTMQNGTTATLKVMNIAGKKVITDVPLVNKGTWNITGGDLNVQFNVTNYGTVNIAKGAEYHQDGDGNVFTNDATTLPERFVLNDPSIDAKAKAKFVEEIGVVNNKGVFATVNNGKINNYGLIEHADKDAKTFISENSDLGTGFGAAFNPENNRMGRINLPYDNKDEKNVSVKAKAATGFVSITVSSDNAPTDKKLNIADLGEDSYVNYVIIEGGVEEIVKVSDQIKYLEINSPGTEIAWQPQFDKDKKVIPYVYEGLAILSPVNIMLTTYVGVVNSTFLAAKMYVGGDFKKVTLDANGDIETEGAPGDTFWNGYFGKTKDNAATMYITY